MCTLSWRADALGYELWFSRVERRTRPIAQAPVEARVRGVRCLAPRDPEGGGSWLSVNEHGIALALLNRYDGERPAEAPLVSRGALVSAHAGSRGAEEVEASLRALPLRCFAPFDLAVLAPGAGVARLGWNGRSLELERCAHGPIASSAVAPDDARAWRTRRAARLQGEAFHRDHAAPRAELATCMHRADAETVSLSRVRVTPERVRFAYAPGAPCRTAFGPELELARA